MPFFTNRGIIPLPAAPGGGDFPEDIYGTALWWAGLRAYSSDTAGDPAIRLLKTSDGTTQADISTDPVTGELDLANAFFTDGAPSGTLYSVVRIYDQLGSGKDLEIGSNLYYLILDGGIPCITNSAGSGYMITGSDEIASTQPFTISWVGMGTGTASAGYQDNTQLVKCGFNRSDVADVASVESFFEEINIAAADDAFHACQFVAKGDGSGTLYVDGASITDDYTSSVVLGGPVVIGGATGSKWRECGAWAGDKSADFAAMNTQQVGFWTDI